MKYVVFTLSQSMFN